MDKISRNKFLDAFLGGKPGPLLVHGDPETDKQYSGLRFLYKPMRSSTNTNQTLCEIESDAKATALFESMVYRKGEGLYGDAADQEINAYTQPAVQRILIETLGADGPAYIAKMKAMDMLKR